VLAAAKLSPAALDNPASSSACQFPLPAAIKEGAKQLQDQARILVYVLATANPKLLMAHGPLQVVGTVEVAGIRPAPAQLQRSGQRRELACSAAPKTAGLFMQLRVRPS
jgi:hypothetical protein